MAKFRAAFIIHVFAVLHAAVTWLCHLGGIDDSLILTLLTMSMTVILCYVKRMSVDFAAIMIVLVNLFGFFLGKWGAALLDRFISIDVLPHIIATFVTTELLGWGLLLFVRFFPGRSAHKAPSWKEDTGWLVAAVTIVFMLRIGINLLLSEGRTDSGTLHIVIDVGAFCLVFVIYFAARMRNRADIERERTHQAEFRYMTLKQQVNPHFLFNCLNILDGIIQEEPAGSDKASRYIHKLAGVYRYLLKHEGESFVRLSDEIEFARMYKELLEERFPQGLVFETDIAPEARPRYIVPCALQLLIENATKHNAITEENPLVIRITADRDSLTVSNNIVPRLSPSPSTGLGQKYIKQLYGDLSGRELVIRHDPDRYSITLPLL